VLCAREASRKIAMLNATHLYLLDQLKFEVRQTPVDDLRIN